MPSNIKSNGFAHITVIVTLLLALAAIGFGAWYVWQKNKTAKSADNTNATQKNTSNNRDNNTTDPSEGGKYLVITEWGVRFELPEGLRGEIEYGIETTPDNRQVAWFEIGKLADIPGSGCKLLESTSDGYSGKRGGASVFLVRSASKVPDSEVANYYIANIAIGDYWYSGGRERYTESCINDLEKEQLVEDTRLPLVYSLEHLVEAQQ